MQERVRATLFGLAATALLAVLIVVGSRNLAHFDAALVGYTFATLFAVFGITYRYAMWLQETPPVTLEISSLQQVEGDIVDYSISPDSRAAGRTVRQLALPAGVVIAVVSRDDKLVPPQGSTRQW